MTPEDVERAWAEIGNEPDPARWLPMETTCYLRALVAIANGEAEPDPVTLARAVVHGSATRQIPEEDQP